MAASCSGFRTISLPFCEQSFDISWTKNFDDPFKCFFRLGNLVDLVVFRMSNYAWKTNLWCQILIGRLITNQIALLLPTHGQTEFNKMCGIDCRRFLFSPPLPLIAHPLSISPQFFAYPRCTPLLACFFACLFNLHLGKKRKWLLPKLCCSTHYIF